MLAATAGVGAVIVSQGGAWTPNGVALTVYGMVGAVASAGLAASSAGRLTVGQRILAETSTDPVRSRQHKAAALIAGGVCGVTPSLMLVCVAASIDGFSVTAAAAFAAGSAFGAVFLGAATWLRDAGTLAAADLSVNMISCLQPVLTAALLIAAGLTTVESVWLAAVGVMLIAAANVTLQRSAVTTKQP